MEKKSEKATVDSSEDLELNLSSWLGSKYRSFSTVQDFIRQSTEIQDEIKTLSEICQKISSKTESGMVEIVNWEKINELLKSLGMKNVIIDDGQIDYDSLIDCFLETIYELSLKVNIIQQNKSALQKLEAENDELAEINKKLQWKVERSKNHKNIKEEVQQLENMSMNMEAKLDRYKQKLREKEEIIKDFRKSFEKEKGIEKFKYNLLNLHNVNEIFEVYMCRKIRENNETDKKIIFLIEMYEKKMLSSLSEFQVILDEFEVSNASQVLACIAKLKYDLLKHSENEKKFKEVYYQIFPEKRSQMYISSIQDICESILERIFDLKNNATMVDDFKANLAFMLGLDKDVSAKKTLKIAKRYVSENAE